jgi:hypothetical protein
MVTICTTSLTFNNSMFCPHSVFMCLYGSENKQRLFPYTSLTGWFIQQRFKTLKPSGHYTYHQFNIHKFHVLLTQYLCVLYGSENKQRLFSYTILTDWFYNRDLTFYSPVVTICTTTWTSNTVYLWVLCGSENKQRLFLYVTLTDRFL